MAGLTVDGLCKAFRTRASSVCAINQLSLCVEAGELLVVVGPSGCGKTTLLRLIAGLEAPDSGVIRIGDRDVAKVDPKDRDVAMVFQDYALYPHMTAFDNVAFGLKVRGTNKDEIRKRVVETAERLGIADLLDRKPAALSGGEQQRVALGRAIIRRPAVFLLDEPLSNLDPSLRVKTRREIRELQRELGTTMVYVTHDQEEAMSLGDRIAVLKGGSVQQCAKPRDIYEMPANRFVAGFVGTPAMTFIAGRIKSDGHRWFLSSRTAMFELPERLATAAAMRPGEDALLGIRPQHVGIVTAEEMVAALAKGSGSTSLTSAGGLEMTVRAVEALGESTDVELVSGAEERCTARMHGWRSLAVGDKVTVRLDLGRAHLYAADDEGVRFVPGPTGG